MEYEVEQNHITIYNDEVANIANVRLPALAKPFYLSLFTNALKHSEAVVSLMLFPIRASAEFHEILDKKHDSFRILQTNNRKSDCAFSILHTNIPDSEWIAELLSLAWINYEYIQIYFLTDASDIKRQEKMILKSVIKPAFGNKKLKSFFAYAKFEPEETHALVYKDTDFGLDQLFTPDPIVPILPLLKSGILLTINFSENVKEAKDMLDWVLSEIGMKPCLNNSDFTVDIRSDEDILIFNISKHNCISFQVVIQYGSIYLNIDKMLYAIDIPYGFKRRQVLTRSLSNLFFCKARVVRKGEDDIKISFLDEKGRTIKTIRQWTFHGLFKKKEVFEYAPFYPNFEAEQKAP